MSDLPDAGTPAAASASQQKFICRYCAQRFKRLDHVQRHERRHTKEAPYKCPCGQAYPRHDLLSRHQKSAHNIEPVKRRKLRHNEQQQQPHETDEYPHDPHNAHNHAHQLQQQQQPPPQGHDQHQNGGSDPQPTHFVHQLDSSNPNPLGTPAPQMADDTPFRSLNHPNSANNPSFYSHHPANVPPTSSANLTVRTLPPNATTAAPLNMANYPRPIDPMIRGQGRLAPGNMQAENMFGSPDFLMTDIDFSNPNPPQMLQNPQVDRSASLASPPTANDGNARAGAGRGMLPPEQQRTYNEDEGDPGGRENDEDEDSNDPDANIFSRIGSPLPSLRNLPGLDPTSKLDRDSRQETGSGPCWKVTQPEYVELQAEVARYAHVLPSNFTLPSRHTMSHYLERTINSLYRHQPCVHIPTFRVREASLELILSMCAVGAQLRFESQAGVAAFYASKDVLMSRLRDRQEESIMATLDKQAGFRSELSATNSLHSQSPNSMGQQNSRLNGGSQPQPGVTENQPRPATMLPERRQRLQSMQTILTLMSFGSWGPKEPLGEAIMLQTLLAMLVREEGFGAGTEPAMIENGTAAERWHAWIEIESWRRIRITSYYFTNLQSLAYNTAPPLATAEVQCFTPGSAAEWAATSAHHWEEVSGMSKITPVPFQEVFRSLFRRDWNDGTLSQGRPLISALGNYALIVGILQCIFFLRQSYPVPFFGDADAINPETGSSLRGEDIRSILRALHRWQTLWEKCPESTIEPDATASPISFNAIACLRLAWIRIYADLGPCRNLATRDPNLIVQVFTSGPPLQRHKRLTPVLLQAIHALSVPVRLGIRFVARSQTMFWSVNQSLCVLECAVILSKWFDALSSTIAHSPMVKQEKNLILMIRAVVLESGFFSDQDLTNLAVAAEKRQLANSSPSNGIGLDANSVSSAGEGNIYGQLSVDGNTIFMPQGPPDNNPDQFGTGVGHDDFDMDVTRIFGIDAGQWVLQEMNMPSPPSPKDDATLYWQRQISSLRIAVARLWAEVLSDNHVFDLVTTVGKTLGVHSRAMVHGTPLVSARESEPRSWF
ncbi:hypothetical protein F5884DRAFT_810383 [Xylogone sp. PMI_703]|nr:hypothetical protein F5884DRAFT_810383 [Xylogone sp. PMI_703]